VRYLLTGGQVADITQASELVAGLQGGAVTGDRAYDSDAFIEQLEGSSMAAVIPSRANRKTPRRLDHERYARRNLIERFFGRVKAFRRVATRYDKTAASYTSSFVLAATLLELSGWTR